MLSPAESELLAGVLSVFGFTLVGLFLFAGDARAATWTSFLTGLLVGLLELSARLRGFDSGR
jgi:hypothetical protein